MCYNLTRKQKTSNFIKAEYKYILTSDKIRSCSYFIYISFRAQTVPTEIIKKEGALA